MTAKLGGDGLKLPGDRRPDKPPINSGPITMILWDKLSQM